MPKESFKEFYDRVCKKTEKKNFKATNSFGTDAVFKTLRKHKWAETGGEAVDKSTFFRIIRKINDLLANEISLGHSVKFPCRMGKIELRKINKGARYVNGKLRVTYPVNWNETVKLWYQDAQAMKDKVLIRNEESTVYVTKYSMLKIANFKNKSFYSFTLNRRIKRNLKENIKQGKIDAFWDFK